MTSIENPNFWLLFLGINRSFVYSFCIILLNILSYMYLYFKFFRFLCFTRLLLEWFPVINPYRWPFRLINDYTNGYFRIWRTMLPSVRFQKGNFEISTLFAIEFMGVFFQQFGYCIFLVIERLTAEQALLPS